MIWRENRRHRLDRRSRLGGRRRPLLHHHFEGIALLGFQVAELILDVEARLLA